MGDGCCIELSDDDTCCLDSYGQCCDGDGGYYGGGYYGGGYYGGRRHGWGRVGSMLNCIFQLEKS